MQREGPAPLSTRQLTTPGRPLDPVRVLTDLNEVRAADPRTVALRGRSLSGGSLSAGAGKRGRAKSQLFLRGFCCQEAMELSRVRTKYDSRGCARGARGKFCSLDRFSDK